MRDYSLSLYQEFLSKNRSNFKEDFISALMILLGTTYQEADEQFAIAKAYWEEVYSS